jgi:hypothetical protein
MVFRSFHKQKDAGPLVIPAIPNRDWRNSSMVVRKPTYVPESHATRQVKKEDLIERSGEDAVKAGLQLTSAKGTQKAVDEEAQVVKMEVDEENGVVVTETRAIVKLEPGTENGEDSIETRAMRALLMEQNGEEKKSDLVIALNDDTLDLRKMPVDETDAFRRDVVTRPTEVSHRRASRRSRADDVIIQSTLDDYAATPIEAFGEALLRGMGWQPNSGQGTQIHVPKRRPDGLGLGATAKTESTNGSSSGSKAGGKRRPDPSKRAGRGYVPVVKRDRDTPASSADVSRNGTPSRAVSRSPDSRDSRDSRRKRDDK